MPLVFSTAIAKNKPDDNRRPSGYCPFCDTASLENIIKTDGDRIWLMNKYPTLQDTTQTVLIETADHDADLAACPAEQARETIRFALACWDEMLASPEYASVLMYKNCGPLSGGSLHHPHMQIVGLKDEDGYEAITPQNLGGTLIWGSHEAEVRVCDEPIVGFFEVNVSVPERPSDDMALDLFSDAIQATVRYLLEEHHGGKCTSYNLFFYRMDGRVTCKVMPRWVTSPYFVGYKLGQVNAPERMDSDGRALRARLEELS